MTTYEVYDMDRDVSLGTFDKDGEAWEKADEHKALGGHGALIEHVAFEDGQPQSIRLVSLW